MPPRGGWQVAAIQQSRMNQNKNTMIERKATMSFDQKQNEFARSVGVPNSNE